jgi:DNA modification methylase
MAVTVFQGDCRVVAATLPAAWFHCVVTSIPYWGLRAYGTEPQVWGGNPDCAHEWGDALSSRRRGQAAGETAQAGNTTKRVCPPELQQGAFCRHCRAWLGELGSEPSLSLFVAHVVEVFRAIRRTMRADSTLWLNVGDCYATTPNGRSAADTKRFGADDRTFRDKPVGTVVDGLKPKDLAMAPAKVALALQEDGWLLRSQIVWTKLAPMPESLGGTHWERCRVKTANGKVSRRGDPGDTGGWPEHKGTIWDSGDGYGSAAAQWADCPGCPKCAATDGLVLRWDSGRPTTATEMVYLFAVGQRYFYDLEAVRVPVSAATLADGRTERGQRGTKGQYAAVDGNAGFNPAGRNLWNYWMLGSEPSREEHYAAYPSELVRRCLAAGTSERGCCPTCGAPWARIVDTHYQKGYRTGHLGYAYKGDTTGMVDRSNRPAIDKITKTLGWRPTCTCAVVTCSSCSRVVELPHGSQAPSTNKSMSDLRGRVSPVQAQPNSLPAGVLRPAPEPASGAVREVREELCAEAEGCALLRQPVRDGVGIAPAAEHTGVVPRSEGLHSGLSAGPPERIQGGLRDAAPAGHGRNARPAAHAGGGRPPQESGEGQQRAGQLGTDDKAGARLRAESPLHGNVPLLRPRVSGEGACPHCGGPLTVAPPSPIPCRTLDPFGGSGTTGLVADQMGRDCALVELKPEYAQMAERRINRDAPLLTTVTVAPPPSEPEGRQLALFPEGGAEG